MVHLHGIPVLLKDSIDTADKLNTTGGSYALEGIPVSRDSALSLKKLREAGAVIIGKSNMSEWGYMRSTRASSGWSARGGQTKNPYVLTRSPCGSSSGSGAAVAANLVTVCHWGRGGWIDSLSGISQFYRGDQAYGRSCEQSWGNSCCSNPGYGWTSDTNGD